MKKNQIISEIIVVNCDCKPKTPSRSFGIKEHSGEGLMRFDISNLKAVNISSKLKKGESCINLEEVIKRFQRNRKNLPADANILDNISSKHFNYIPKRLSKPGTYLLFLGTTYLKKGGVLCVRALNYAKNGWYETVLLDGDHFANKDFVVCFDIRKQNTKMSYSEKRLRQEL